jgi:hypothetical protein
MNAPRYWQRRNERSSLLEAVQKMPSGLLRPVELHYSAINFSSAFAIHSRIANSCMRWRGMLKSSHRMGDGQIFLKISAPLSLIKAFRMNLISAGSIVF